MDINQYTLHYAGLEISVPSAEKGRVENALAAVTNGKSMSQTFSSGWTVLFTPGVPIALHVTPRMPAVSSGPALAPVNPTYAGPPPLR